MTATVKYGFPAGVQAASYEAWLRRQPTCDLRVMLADDELLRDDEKAFIRQVISERRSPSRDEA